MVREFRITFRITKTPGDWQGIQSVTDYKTTPLSCDNTEFLNDLNKHFARFDALSNKQGPEYGP